MLFVCRSFQCRPAAVGLYRKQETVGYTEARCQNNDRFYDKIKIRCVID